MPSKTRVSVAIFKSHGGVYKHWSLFLEGPRLPDKFLLHIVGGSQKFEFELVQKNANTAPSLSEIVKLCEVDASKVDAIKERATNMVIHNEHAGYNCQDYVLDLLDDLEKEEIIDAEDKEYTTKKKVLKAKQDGV